MCRYFSSARTATLGIAILAWVCSDFARAEQDRTPVPMLIEIVLDRSTCVVHENFGFNVRIVNPNDFPVIIPGVNLDYYVEPKIYLVRDEEEDLRLRYHASVNPWTKIPITIQPGQALEKHRFLWRDNIAAMSWPDKPGTYRLRADFSTQVRLENDETRHSIEWEQPIAQVRVLPPNTLDRQASAWLYQQFANQSRRKSVPGVPRDVTVERTRMYDEFLSRFADSSYAPAIRWETAKLLLSKLGNDRIPDEEVPRMVDLFDECIGACLDKGGAYADEFLRWDMDKGGNRPMDLAIKYKRIPLMDRIVGELDKHHPEDEPAKLWRHAHVAGYKQSGKAARDILQSIIERFPDSRYATAARSQIATIDRKGWPPERRE